MENEQVGEERIAELAEAYLESWRQGDAQSIETFVAAHPQEADELRELLPAMMEVERLSQATRPRVASMTAFPEELGGYKILERIGCGGMGAVFRALQESLRREVAIKILSPAWNADAQHCAAFEQESQVIARLRHTNIVEIYGAGQEGDYRYYVMSLVKGQGVTPSRIRQAYPGIPYEQAVARVGLQAAEALAFAHSQGVLHRDVKPGNLLLDEEGVLHVGDFGLATVLNGGEAAPLVTQSHDGTLRYMAPERLIRGENSYAADQYALGLTLYELLANRAAFKEVEPGALIRRICAAPLEPLCGEGELGAVINKAVSFEPTDRYTDMEAMVADLRRYLAGVPVVARPTPLLRRYMMWWRRRPAVAVWSHVAGATVALLLASISIGYVSVRRSLDAENAQRLRAEQNARIADASLNRIFSSMVPESGGTAFLQSTKSDARLLQDLMPYYEEIVSLGDDGEGKMADACMTLATIALRTGEYATAEEYFARANKLLPASSVESLRATNGLIAAMLRQQSRAKQEQALELVRETLASYAGAQDFEQRLELVHTLRMLTQPPQRNLMEEPLPQPTELRKHRQTLLKRKAELVAELLKEQPKNTHLRLLQLELLEEMPSLRKLMAPHGETPQSLLESLLEEEPDNVLCQRAYIRWALRLNYRKIKDIEALRVAAEYARTLLADHPTETDFLMQYLAVRERYASALEQSGDDFAAALENAQTLGALSLVTSRADFSPEMRERLAMLVAMHPDGASGQKQREAEINLLLEKHDEAQRQKLRERMKILRREMRRRLPIHRRFRQHRP